MMFLMMIFVLADPWGDASPAVHYGEGAGFGQSFYPENILGPPCPDASPTSPAHTEDELLTLGKDGWIVIQFTDNIVVNGPGPDFTVFENVMETPSGYFRELAFVEVSQDGELWTMFPWNGETFEGLAGVWPTTGEDPTNPEVSGGDQFDLDDVGLDWISWIRITDCGDSVQDGGLFDLDAVAAIHWTTGIQLEALPSFPLCISSPFTETFTAVSGDTGALQCYSLDGRLLNEWQMNGTLQTLYAGDLPSGPLLFKLNQTSFSAIKLAN